MPPGKYALTTTTLCSAEGLARRLKVTNGAVQSRWAVMLAGSTTGSASLARSMAIGSHGLYSSIPVVTLGYSHPVSLLTEGWGHSVKANTTPSDSLRTLLVIVRYIAGRRQSDMATSAACSPYVCTSETVKVI
ncbi:hypothetical protein Bbelb_042140 [Branchiostoma belcheri]|nr:hypothetical protein Bbelb_042140 [Branchiostoma belcheri]